MNTDMHYHSVKRSAEIQDRLFFLELHNLSLSLLPAAHTNFEAKRLAQETFSGLEHGLVGLEFIAAEDGGDDEGEFHLKDNKSVAKFWVAVLGVSDSKRTSATLRPTQERGPYEKGMKALLCL
jgi:hypothetical protein